MQVAAIAETVVCFYKFFYLSLEYVVMNMMIETTKHIDFRYTLMLIPLQKITGYAF